MSHLDRLTVLVQGMSLSANAVASGGTLWLDDAGGQIIFDLGGVAQRGGVHLHLNLGDPGTALMLALPDRMAVDLTMAPDLRALVQVLIGEVTATRCAGGFAVDRLCELILVHVLRAQLETGDVALGPLAGLAHRQLAPVLVAIHDQPGRIWRADDFATMAGMSRSAFMATFHKTVGQSPMAYLKDWRMGLARAALGRGDRVNVVARRSGYQTAEAFTRAYTQAFGHAPAEARPR